MKCLLRLRCYWIPPVQRARCGADTPSRKRFRAALRPGDRIAIVSFKYRAKGQSVGAKVDVLTLNSSTTGSTKQSDREFGNEYGTPFYDALWKNCGGRFS